ncbi:hypothetical protein PsYK624_166960 [Phanerochaete sordida]|uniref:Uncharacterized protein n=1 Tax=Phanerochaete sordida TaxID=48140 RepID=A0A9P3LNZ2_9APHY|nr:hypothetical protein PsYK624_166960 [Phanerochaete sordida]
MEGEQARIEVLGGDVVTQDEFVQQALESPRGNTDASSAFSSSPGLSSLSLFHPSSPFSFESDLHTIPPLPLNPDDPLSWSPVRQPHGSMSFSVFNSHVFPTSHLQDDRASEASSDREATPDTDVPDTLQDAPAWVVFQYNKFLEEDVPDKVKEDWNGLLDDWVALEREMGFSTPHNGFSPTDRPEALGLWVKKGRKKHIEIKNPCTFCSAWYHWWKSVNPAWRREAGDVLAIEGDGNWSTMFLPGPNRFLNVLGSLLGVRDIERNDEKWICAVRDVRWTVSQVLAAK